uniref:Uncharacterized protein n=1 Tax=Romanomermis culicivorax TaxID=13658 RepID=A0A915HX78_ROMCU
MLVNNITASSLFYLHPFRQASIQHWLDVYLIIFLRFLCAFQNLLEIQFPSHSKKNKKKIIFAATKPPERHELKNWIIVFYLNSIVSPICYENSIVAIDGQAGRRHKLTIARPVGAKLRQKFARAIVNFHLVVVKIGDENSIAAIDGSVMRSGQLLRPVAPGAEFADNFEFRHIENEYRTGFVVDDDHVTVPVDAYALGAQEADGGGETTLKYFFKS